MYGEPVHLSLGSCRYADFKPGDVVELSPWGWGAGLAVNYAYTFGKVVKFELGILTVQREGVDRLQGDISPTAAHIWSLYRAAWLGRYFQEAGLEVIPRIEFFQEKSQLWSLMGIPYDAPIVATQFQTEFDEENVPAIERNLRDALNLIRAKHLLVYAGKKGRAMIEKFDLPCDLTVLKTSSEVRKKEIREKETDPHLLELRKRRRGREAKRATTSER